MFEEGGISYVYLCYGVHELFNVVTNRQHIPDAVLIRALEPVEGIDHMLKRAGKNTRFRITSGPGKLSVALGITRALNAVPLSGDQVWIEDRSINIPATEIAAGERIGLNFNGKDARLPWRFTIKGNTWVSK